MNCSFLSSICQLLFLLKCITFKLVICLFKSQDNYTTRHSLFLLFECKWAYTDAGNSWLSCSENHCSAWGLRPSLVRHSPEESEGNRKSTVQRFANDRWGTTGQDINSGWEPTHTQGQAEGCSGKLILEVTWITNDVCSFLGLRKSKKGSHYCHLVTMSPSVKSSNRALILLRTFPLGLSLHRKLPRFICNDAIR